MTHYGKIKHTLAFDTGRGHRLDLDLIVDVDTNYVQYHVSGEMPVGKETLPIDKYFGEFWQAQEEFNAIQARLPK